MKADDEKRIQEAINNMRGQLDDAVNPMIAVHELYVQLRKVQFTENQACKIIGAMFANAGENK